MPDWDIFPERGITKVLRSSLEIGLGGVIAVAAMHVLALECDSSFERVAHFPHDSGLWLRIALPALVVWIIGMPRRFSLRRQKDPAASNSVIKYGLLFDETPDAVLIYALDGTCLDCNSAACRLFGHSNTDMRALTVADLVPPDFRNRVPNLLQVAAQTGGLIVEFGGLTKDGRIFPTEFTARIIYIKDQPQILVHIRDITERKRAVNALKRRLDIEKITAGISTDFVNLTAEDIPSRVTAALGTIARFVGADRSCVFEFSSDCTFVQETYEWCEEGLELATRDLPGSDLSLMPWWMERMHKLEPVRLYSSDSLPEDANIEREGLVKRGIEALVALPTLCRGKLVGFVAYGSSKPGTTWTDEDVELLRTFGELVTSTLQRRRSDEALHLDEA